MSNPPPPKGNPNSNTTLMPITVENLLNPIMHYVVPTRAAERVGRFHSTSKPSVRNGLSTHPVPALNVGVRDRLYRVLNAPAPQPTMAVKTSALSFRYRNPWRTTGRPQAATVSHHRPRRRREDPTYEACTLASAHRRRSP